MAAAFIDGSAGVTGQTSLQRSLIPTAPDIARNGELAREAELRRPVDRLPPRRRSISAQHRAETWVRESVARLRPFAANPLDAEDVLGLGHRLAAIEDLLARYGALPAPSRSLNRFMILEASALSAALVRDSLEQTDALWVSDAAMRCYLKALRAIWSARADTLQIYAVAGVFDDYLARACRNMRAIATRMAPLARLKLAAVYSPQGLLYAVYRDGRLVHSAVRPGAAEHYRDVRLVPVLEHELEAFIAHATRTQARVIESYQKLCGAVLTL